MKKSYPLILALLLVACSIPPPSADAVLFNDVREDSFAYPAIQWAVERGITSGYASGDFRPQNLCARQHVIAFMWRYCGSPVYDSAFPFADIAPDGVLGNAAHWAYLNGIELGGVYPQSAPLTVYQNDAGRTIAPVALYYGNIPCSRLEAMTYLYKLAGCPVVDTSTLKFTDVADIDLMGQSAIAWAVDAMITAGLSDDTFGPYNSCNRGQMITFLYRYDRSVENAE